LFLNFCHDIIRHTPRALFSPNLLFLSFSLGLYPPLQNKCPVIIESEGKVWSVSMHKVNRIMRFRGGERKGEGRKKGRAVSYEHLPKMVRYD